MVGAFLYCLCLRVRAPPTEYKTPLKSKTHPNIHPESSPETKLRKKYEKHTKIGGVFVIFSYFFCILHGFGRGFGVCLILNLGCVLDFRGVLYFVGGAGTRKFMCFFSALGIQLGVLGPFGPSVSGWASKRFLGPLGPRVASEVSPRVSHDLSGTKIASQNRSDHGGRKRARNHSGAEIAGFFALPAAKKSLAASDFWGWPQNRRKIAATTAASRRSRAISRPQRPRDTKLMRSGVSLRSFWL